MALIECKECKKEISDGAKICPNCGAKTEKAKKSNKRVAIIISCVLLLIILSVASMFIINKLNDKTNLTAKEVISYLESKGYNFNAYKSTISAYTTYYIYVDNDKSDIAFQRIDNAIISTIYSWKNGNINDKWTDIKSPEKNETAAEKKQYEAYQKWLNKLGLIDTQIIDALDYYKRNTTTYENMYY